MKSRKARTADTLGILMLLAVSVAGAIGIAYATIHGPWTYSDSIAYIVSATNLAQGRGLGLLQASGDFSPLIHYPPAYPLALSVGSFFHLDVLAYARWLNVCLFGLLVLLVGRLVYRYSRSRWLPILVALVIVTSPVLIDLYSGAMSEALFIFLIMAGLLVLAEALSTGARSLFVLAGCIAGLASLTRYTGVALIVVGPICILLLAGGRLRQRLTSAVAYLLPALALLAVWLLAAGRMAAGSPVRVFMTPSGDLWEASRPLRADLADTLWRLLPLSSLLPHPPYWLIHLAWITCLLGAFVLGVAVLGRARRLANPGEAKRRSSGLLVALLSCYVLAHLGIVGLAYLFTLPTPDLNERMLSPALPPAWLLGIMAIPVLLEVRPRLRWSLIIPFTLVAVVVSLSAPEAERLIADLHANGRGYTSQAWRESETIEAVRSLSASTPLISNESAALLLLTGRPAHDLPQVMEPTRRPHFTRFGDDLTSAPERVFRQEQGALVLFESAVPQLQTTYGDEAAARLAELTDGLETFAQLADGAIYFYPEAK